jgi:hypothetical protein
LEAPADAGRPVHCVRGGAGPAVRRRVAGDQPLDLRSELPGGRGTLPARHLDGRFSPPGGLFAALFAVAAVEQEVHRGSAGCAGQGADDQMALGLHGNRNSKFHRDADLDPTRTIDRLLAEIDADPICIFWG